MQSVTKYPPNTFAWIDLATPDAVAAKQFYTQLFGWEAVDIPLPDGSFYTMLQQDGKDVAGLGAQQEEELAQGNPAFWSSYVAVEDIDATAQKAEAAGAIVIVPPFDVLDSGRMAVLRDPTGAFVSLWQPRNHVGAQLVNIPNALCWNELYTRDTARAKQFYTEVFGWEGHVDENDASPEPYITFFNQGRAAGGMMSMTEEWEGIPEHWSIYFAVEDAQATAEHAEALGGTVVTPPFEAESVGTIAVLQDPQGATFNVIRMLNPDPMP